ncbi:MAG TPA: OsmC family protein [Caulobacteraceae bacterium]|jgi:organic hydroperoxide reductase OsmC/OhrA
MAGKTHAYHVDVEWTGNDGQGAKSYTGYRRDHVIRAEGNPDIPGSSDPNFRGDPARWNPEELLVASLSACHKLWCLHLCSVAGLVVQTYVDHAEGVMEETGDGSGRFTRVILHPDITLSAGDPSKLDAIHHEAHAKCFIANSVNFPVTVEGTVSVVA